jgi:heat shock protein 5
MECYHFLSSCVYQTIIFSCEQVREAEEFADEDKQVKETIDARNGLEGYVYSLKNSVNDKDKFGEKIDAEDKETIEEAVKAALDWMEDNTDASKDDYDEQKKKLEGVANPIMTKLYQQNGGAAGKGSDESWGDDIPNDEL